MSKEDKMTDIEAYELLVKYAGEKGIVLIKEMIHVAGVDVALKNMERSYNNNGHKISYEFKDWMRQAFDYLAESIKAAN